MLAHDVLRAAARIVEAGWVGEGDAADAAGRPVDLFSKSVGGTGRSGLNPYAARFSAYGAVAKAAHIARADVPPFVWSKLAETAKALMVGRQGGTNHVHPLKGFNAAEGRTAAEVAALLDLVADEIDPAKWAVAAGRAT